MEAYKMSKTTYYVTPRSDGDWNVKKEGSSRASAVTSTQREAESIAKDYLYGSPSGGEVRIQDRHGRFRDSDTINRPDPNPPHDKKH